MAARIRAHDWTATSLGMVDSWPTSLRVATRLLVNSRHPMFIWWGSEHLQIYNDAYRETMGPEKHPSALGRSGRETWAEIWDVIGPQIEQVMNGGPATWHEDQLVPVTRHSGLEAVCWTYSFSPIEDDAAPSGVGGVMVICRDVTREHLARVAVAESEARHRFMIESWAQAVWETDPDGVVIADSPTWREHTGQTLEEWLGYGWLDAIHPDDRAYAERQWREAVAVRGVFNAEFRLRFRDGGWRWTNVRAAPVLDAEGRIEKWVGMNIDIHESKLARQALDASEQFTRALVEGVPQLVWRAADGGGWTWASPQWTAFTGQSEPESHGHGWLEPVHPDDREEARRCWHEAKATGRLEMDVRIRHVSTGNYRWFQTRAKPVRASDGSIVEWLGTSTDVDDLRRLQDRQQILVAELQHRVRNILTVVRSVFTRTAEADTPLEQVVDHFRGRLDNLARTQVVVSQSATGAVDLHGLIFDELLSVGFAESPNVTLDGPEVKLDPTKAESIGLAIHELTTNAVKYGALKVAGATLAITWSINSVYGETGTLNLIWTEQGVPAVPLKPGRQGFGSELIEEALPYRLGAETKLEFRGGGVRCTISVPLSDEPATAETWETV